MKKELLKALFWTLVGGIGMWLLWRISWKIEIGVFLMIMATYNSLKQEFKLYEHKKPSEITEAIRENMEGLCKKFDDLEFSDPNKSTENWRNYKFIRNNIRDFFLFKERNEIILPTSPRSKK